SDWRLIGAAIVSLHLAHVPYWFEGIMGWHYVFESAPYWLLIFAGVGHVLWQFWVARKQYLMPIWWCALIVTSAAVNLITVPPFWPARLDVAVAEVSFSRRRYADFYAAVEHA